MMQTVQLSIADNRYATTLREALARSCAWHVAAVERPDLSRQCVIVLDEQAFVRLPLPLSNPERIVLVARKEPRFLSQAWEAGIVSVVSEEDPLNTVLLAIMAAALRVAKTTTTGDSSGITPYSTSESAPIAPLHGSFTSKRSKFQ